MLSRPSRSESVHASELGETALARVLIHPLAVVDDDCEIGIGTSVWQFASVIRGARIGVHCNIGAATLLDGVVLGRECAVAHGAQLHPGTLLGDRVFVGPGAIACNDVWPSVDKDGWELPTGGKYTVVVEDGASIGAGAILLPGAHIKKGALVAAGAVCSRVVPPGAVYQRNHYTAPQRPLDWQKRRMRFVQSSPA